MSEGPWCNWCDKENPSEKHLEKHRRSTDVTFTTEELAEHDRRVAERAWGAGYWVGIDRDGYHGPDLNPHRAAKGEQK